MKSKQLIETEVGLGQPHNTFTSEEEAEFEALMDKLDEIGYKNGFQTTWSVIEVEDVYGYIGIQPLYLTDGIHNEVKIELPNIELKWLDLWKASEQLYQEVSKLDDFMINHRFIEVFELKELDGKPYLEVFFGS
jgi:hypothetical protein